MEVSFRLVCVDCDLAVTVHKGSLNVLSRTGWEAGRATAGYGGTGVVRCPSCTAKFKASRHRWLLDNLGTGDMYYEWTAQHFRTNMAVEYHEDRGTIRVDGDTVYRVRE